MKQVFGPSAPTVEFIKYRGQDVETRGLSYDQLIILLRKHPSVIGLIDGSVDNSGSLADDAITAMVGMATGVYGDDEQMAHVAAMSAGEKAAFLASVIRQTAPTGVGPFVDLLIALGAASAVSDDSTQIKLRTKKSPEQPQNLPSQDSAAAA